MGGETESITGVTIRTQKTKTKTKRHISSLKFFNVINWVRGPPQCDIWISSRNGNSTIFFFPNMVVTRSNYWGEITKKWAVKWQKANIFVKIE